MLKNHRLTLALAFALGSSQALALGLGSIEVRSGLNEPLVAVIPVLGATPAELEELRVRLASPEAFARIGIDRPAVIASNLDFSVDRDAQGRPVVRITTATNVRDPFLNFLVEVEWQRGRLLREYTVLLDPPVTSRMRTAPPATAPSRQPTPVVTAAPAPTVTAPAERPVSAAVTSPLPAAPQQPLPQPLPAPVAAAPAPRPAAAAGSIAAIAEGQTLWQVAQQVRPAGVDANQTMLALLRANPEAFIGGNINQLRTGAILRIPSAEEFAALSAADAAGQVRTQTETWRGATALQPVESSARRTAAPGTPRPPVDSRLEVVPPSGDTAARDAQSGTAAAEGRELRADLARTREEVGTLQQENRELKSRVGDLEKLETDTRALIALKDSQLADAERTLARLQAERDAAAAALAAAPITAAAPAVDLAPALDPAATVIDADADVVAAMDADAMDADAIAADAGTMLDGSEVIDLDGTGEPVVAADPFDSEVASPPDIAPAFVAEAEPMAAPAPVVAQPAATPRPWFMNPLVIGGAVIALIGIVLALFRRRKTVIRDEPRRNGVSEAYAAATAGAAVDTFDEDQPEVDGERSLEQQLLDEVAEQPDDLSAHLALVSYYYGIGDNSGFEGAAEAMYAQLYDPDEAAWKQVLAMGAERLPNHPLFESAQPVAAVASPVYASPPVAQRNDFDEYSFEDQATDDLSVQQPAVVETVEAEHEYAASSFGAATASHGSQSVEWDDAVDDSEALQSAPDQAMPPAVTPVADELEADLGFDLDFGDTDLPDFSTSAAQDSISDADSGLDGDDAAATKLELARAYLDMGDVEGARGMLEEVVGEGNAGQRSEAKRLLDEIR